MAENKDKGTNLTVSRHSITGLNVVFTRITASIPALDDKYSTIIWKELRMTEQEEELNSTET